MSTLDGMATTKHPFAKVGGHLQRQGRRRMPPKRAPSLAEVGHDDFRGRTKAELLERARRLGLAGRSRMSKAELVRALARAH